VDFDHTKEKIMVSSEVKSLNHKSLLTFLTALSVMIIAIAGPATLAQQYEHTRLLASDGLAYDHLGQHMSFSNNRALIGSQGCDGNGTSSGAAYSFVYDPGTDTWIEELKFEASDAGANDRFGSAVAIDGQTALIGAAGDWIYSSSSGSAYIFRFDPGSGTWNEEAKLIPSVGGTSEEFGSSVALSVNVAVIGAPQAETSPNVRTGRAFVFRHDPGSGTWNEEALLLPADVEEGDCFGWSVAASGDRVLIGSVFDGDLGIAAGAVYMYLFDPGSGTWNLEVKLLASDGDYDDVFGYSVALENDLALVGATHEDDLGPHSGAVYVFRRDSSSGVWNEEAKLLASDGDEFDFFGQDVALYGDTALVGAPRGDFSADEAGGAYFFRYDPSGGTWSEEKRLKAADGMPHDWLGDSVGLWGDVAVAAAPYHDGLGDGAGAAYAYDLTELPPVADVKVNDQDADFSLPYTDSITVTVSMDPREGAGAWHDWWIWAHWDRYSLEWWWVWPGNWIKGGPRPALTWPLVSVNNYQVGQTLLPTGLWTFGFAVDAPDTVYQGSYRDEIEVTVY